MKWVFCQYYNSKWNSGVGTAPEGEGEEKEEKEKAAEEEADGEAVKRPAEEEVGSKHFCLLLRHDRLVKPVNSHPDIFVLPRVLCLQESVETKKQKTEENGESTEAEVKA